MVFSKRGDEGLLRRRDLIRMGALGGAGLAAAALIGCGDDDEDDAPSGPSGGAATQAPSGQAPAQPDFAAEAKAEGAPYPYNYAEPAGAPKSGGTLKVGVPWDGGTSYDLTKSQTQDALNIGIGVANRLVNIFDGPKMNKKKVELAPELAKSWEAAPDGLSHTFRLATNVKFHNVSPLDGRAFTGSDVVQAYNRFKAGGQNAPFFEAVDTISAPDAATVRITMKRPDPDLLFAFATRFMHIFPTELYDKNLIDTTPIGTGPLIWQETQKGQLTKAKANPDYFEGKPYMDGIEWRTIKDVATQTAAFRTEQIDFGYSMDRSQAGIAAMLKTNPDILISSDPVLNGIHRIFLHPQNPKFKDDRVRQALMVAMDRPKMNQIIYQNASKTMPGFGWPFIFDKEPTGKDFGPWWEHNAAEAKKMLAAAGASNLEFDLVTSVPIAPSIVAQNDVLVPMLRDVGVTMNLKNPDFPAYNAQYFGKQWAKNVGEAINGFGAPAAPSANGFFYDPVHSTSAKNLSGVVDSELDDWSQKQRTELNPGTRKELQRKIWDKTLNKAYYLDLSTSFVIFVVQPWVRYYRYQGAYQGVTWSYDWGRNFHKAWLAK